MNLSRLLSMLRNDRRLSEINARGLWHAIHFNLRSVSFMPRDNDDVLVPVVCLPVVNSRTLYILDLSRAIDGRRFVTSACRDDKINKHRDFVDLVFIFMAFSF